MLFRSYQEQMIIVYTFEPLRLVSLLVDFVQRGSTKSLVLRLLELAVSNQVRFSSGARSPPMSSGCVIHFRGKEKLMKIGGRNVHFGKPSH